MFPEKVGVSFADFSVTYHKTYKIVTNMKENKQYLLTQVAPPTSLSWRGCLLSRARHYRIFPYR